MTKVLHKPGSTRHHKWWAGIALLAVVVASVVPGRLSVRGLARSNCSLDARQAATPHKASRSRLLAAYTQMPLSFEINQGQSGPQVKFLSRGGGYSLFLTGDQAVLALQKSEGRSQKSEASILVLKLVGANPNPIVRGSDELPGKSNYFTGSDPKSWRTSVPTYGKVRYHDVYPGVDLVYYGTHGQLEYDFVVAPGVDPNRIAFSLETGNSSGQAAHRPVRLDENGDLTAQTSAGTVRFCRPVLYQPAADGDRTGKRLLGGQYVLKGAKRVAFKIAPYDRTRPLVIDPVALIYSTYLGGAANDFGYGIAVDSSGDAYVTGTTASLNFPVGPCFQCVNLGGNGVFVTKFNPGATAPLIYSTYLGGSGNDIGYGIALDPSRDAYVTGSTTSRNFPVAACIGPFGCALNGGTDAFVTELNPAGNGLIYSDYLGGAGKDAGNGISVDANDQAYVTGSTTSLNFPLLGCILPFGCANSGGSDAFVAVVRPFGAALAFSTYLGGRLNDIGYGISALSQNAIFVTGSTASNTFPITPGVVQPVYGGGATDAFVTEINAIGVPFVVYSTFLGGGRSDIGYSIAVAGNLDAYVTGSTTSAAPTPFPTTPGAFQPVLAGGTDAFVTEVNPAGNALVYSTYLGGTGNDFGRGIALDTAGEAYVTGYTTSLNFPVPGCFQCVNAGGNDAFVTKFTAPGNPLVYSTYLGGRLDDFGRSIAVDPGANAYVTGYTSSINFPFTAGVFQPANAGGTDAFAAKLH